MPQKPYCRVLAALAAGVMLSGCSFYHPDPLADKPDLADGLTGLSLSAAEMPLPELRRRTVDPSRPLDADEVAMIAIARNPDLRTARAKAHVTHAEAFAAGLLPDPTFSADYAIATSGVGAINAYTFGLVEEVMPFLTRSSREDQAKSLTRGADLSLLWQEWQVVSQARLLTVRAVMLRRQRDLLEENRSLFRHRYETTRAALSRGDQTLPNLVADLGALTAVETQLNEIERQSLDNRLDLDALLGLDPKTELDLASEVGIEPPDAATIRADLPVLVERRPDLLALKAGYAAQEETMYQAVLAQFPLLSVGVSRSSDNTNSKAIDPAVSIGLPLFNRGRGAIAVERANRESLKRSYLASLDTATAGVEGALIALDQLSAQRHACADSLARLEDAASASAAARDAGNLDERSFADLEGALLARRLDAVKLDQAILEQKVALLTLIGSDVPAAQDKDANP